MTTRSGVQLVNGVWVSNGYLATTVAVPGGPHTHPESDVTGLAVDLAAKAPAVHTHSYAATSHSHPESDVTSLTTDLAGKAASSHNHDSAYAAAGHSHAYASTSHTHAEADVTSLVTDLAGKAASAHTHTGTYAPASHSHAESDTTNLVTDLAGKAASNHNHDVAYAPIGAKYIVQTADATLTAEQSLGALATGILKNTTSTGVLSIAVGADLPSHTHAESDVTNLVSDLAAKATAGAALTEVAEASSSTVAGATSTAIGSGVRTYEFFTLPSTELWYLITAIEWLNKATVNGNVWCGVDIVDASPPVAAGTVSVAVGMPVAQAGTNAAQKNTRIASRVVRGGTLLAVWFVSDSATGTFGNTAGSNVNRRKSIAAGAPGQAENAAWAASTAQYYVKAYYRGVK